MGSIGASVNPNPGPVAVENARAVDGERGTIPAMNRRDRETIRTGQQTPSQSQLEAEIEAQNSADPNLHPTPEPQPAGTGQSASAIVPSGSITIPTTKPNLSDFLDSLTAEQLSRVRKLAQTGGISLGRGKNPDGSLDISLHIESILVEQLELWADGDGMSLEDEARKVATESIQNYVCGDWSATVVKPQEVQRPAWMPPLPAPAAAK